MFVACQRPTPDETEVRLLCAAIFRTLFVRHVDVAVELMFVACQGPTPDETEVGSCCAVVQPWDAQGFFVTLESSFPR